jgi:F0F1-type ATP synthase assembly protein I
VILENLQGNSLLLDAELLKKTGVFAFVSTELLVTIGGGYLGGKWIDQRLNSAPYVAVSLAMLGLCYSVWRILRLSKTWLKKE